MKKSLKYLIVVMSIFMLVLTSAETIFADGHEGDCTIPEAGPWPPCATGGEATDAWAAHNSMDTDSTDCVIPDSGPWPPCATGGVTAAPDADDASDSDGDDAEEEAEDSADHDAEPEDTRRLPTDEEWEEAFDRLYVAEVEDDMLADARVPLIYDWTDEEGVTDTYTTSYFPVETEFNSLDFWVSAASVDFWVDQMGGLMDRLIDGHRESCADYNDYYFFIAISPTFTDVPAEYQSAVAQYESAIFTLLDSNKDLLVQACFTGGAVSDLNYWRARAGINDARDELAPVLTFIAGMYEDPQ